MLNDKSLQLLHYIVKICQYSGATPFCWDKEKCRLFISARSDLYCWFWLRFKTDILAYLIVRTIHLKYYTDNVANSNFSLAILFAISIHYVLRIQYAFYGEDFALLVNSCLDVVQDYGRKWNI